MLKNLTETMSYSTLIVGDLFDLFHSMLNGVLMVGVPMMVLLAAALYMFKRSQSESPQGRGARTSRREPWGAGMCGFCLQCVCVCVCVCV